MPARIPPLAITAYTATCAAARGLDALSEAVRERRGGLDKNDLDDHPLACFIGRVAGLEETRLPAAFRHHDARNNRLAWLGLNQDGFLDKARALRDRYGADRVALVLGTSTSSIGETESAYRHLDADGRFAPEQRRAVHQPHSLGMFVQDILELAGPCLSIATACSSSAKVFASAERLLRAGIVDAAIVGGVDTLCGSVLYGFNSLALVAPQACRPFDVARCGLSLGEAAGFAILERADDTNAHVNKSTPCLVGYGESSDAHHMSAPHPHGLGAQLAIEDALTRAGIGPADVDYINLHGTATPQNDAVEAALIARLFPATTLASSTKGWTGHALGAAGIVEAAMTLLALERGLVPGTLNLETPDPVCGPQIMIDNREQAIGVALSNSFGFGGNNCCLAFAHAQADMSIDVVIEGVGLWSPTLPGWQASQDVLTGKAEPVAGASARPAGSLLAPAERRRAPDSVLFALEVAQQAAQMAAREGSTLRGVFASDHGDLAINDYLCTTLAQAPEQLSPTKFHNSVHNAPAGYWAIATGCMASTTALSAGDYTFAAGLFEAALLAQSEDAPVLFVACDLPACGPLADVVSCRTPFAVALVLSPRRDRGGAALRLASHGRPSVLAPEPALLHAVCGDNPVARSLPLLVALARGEAQTFTLQAGPRLYLELEISPWLN